MNKKMIFCTAILLLIVISKDVIAMHNKILTASKCVGASLVMLPGIQGYAHYREKKNKKIYRATMPKKVHDWARKIVDRYDLPKKDSIGLFIVNNNELQDWQVTSDGNIAATTRDVREIKNNLKILEKAQKRAIVSEAEIIRAQKVLAWHEYCLQHECGHVYYEHRKKNAQERIIVPFLVQSACSIMTFFIKYVVKVKPPTVWYQTTFRSLGALIGVVPKVIVSTMILKTSGLFPTFIMQEEQADRFAFESAQSRLTLETVRDVHLIHSNESPYFSDVTCLSKALDYADNLSDEDRKNRLNNDFRDKAYLERDPIHPAPRARAVEAQNYLYKWDTQA